MKKVIKLVAAALLLACSQESRAEVRCEGAGVGYNCTVSHVQGDAPLSVCWTVRVLCVNGTETSGSACQAVQPHGQASTLIPLSDFPNAAACDMPRSVSVEDMRLSAQ